MTDNVVQLKEDKFISENATAVTVAGVVSIVVGSLGIVGGVFTGILAIEALGAMMIISGGFQFFQIFRRSTWAKRFTSLALSALYVLSGIFIAATPLSSAATVTLLLGFVFIASGITKVIMTAEIDPIVGKAWMYFSAGLSVLLGAMIVSSWPVGSADLLGFMVSLELISAGITFVSVGTAIKEDEKHQQKVEDKFKSVDKRAA
jgi:uncharacterized membrane protein HdeD (DUF308 family)